MASATAWPGWFDWCRHKDATIRNWIGIRSQRETSKAQRAQRNGPSLGPQTLQRRALALSSAAGARLRFESFETSRLTGFVAINSFRGTRRARSRRTDGTWRGHTLLRHWLKLWRCFMPKRNDRAPSDRLRPLRFRSCVRKRRREWKIPQQE